MYMNLITLMPVNVIDKRIEVEEMVGNAKMHNVEYALIKCEENAQKTMKLLNQIKK